MGQLLSGPDVTTAEQTSGAGVSKAVQPKKTRLSGHEIIVSTLVMLLHIKLHQLGLPHSVVHAIMGQTFARTRAIFPDQLL